MCRGKGFNGLQFPLLVVIIFVAKRGVTDCAPVAFLFALSALTRDWLFAPRAILGIEALEKATSGGRLTQRVESLFVGYA
ncbi:hypothetical protein BKH28_09205 [Actinomyces oris]|uniref:Uncharacterized protein n=1 Tax=Actinomyces oris TaxID=544580 RepID=A0A1Q8VKR3_9ACTO|nr:hypothetical protein BKH28_09205 [Actinomyces oris]